MEKLIYAKFCRLTLYNSFYHFDKLISSAKKIIDLKFINKRKIWYFKNLKCVMRAMIKSSSTAASRITKFSAPNAGSKWSITDLVSPVDAGTTRNWRIQSSTEL